MTALTYSQTRLRPPSVLPLALLAAALLAGLLLLGGPAPDSAATFADGAQGAREAVGYSTFSAAKLGVSPE